MESSSHSQVKPIIASNVSSESLQKYKEKISDLPKYDGWSPLTPLFPYKGFWFPSLLLEGVMYAQDHFQAQPTDIFLCSPMKVGCTWLKALSFAIVTRAQFTFSDSPLRNMVSQDCIPLLEFCEYFTASAPRIPLFCSHVPYTLLPKSVIDSDCKIVYLCRDPKDTFVSLWHFYRNILQHNHPGKQDLLASMEEAFELFCKGLSSIGPYWDHVLGYWKASLERPDKMLFLKYEDMTINTQDCARKLAHFFGCPFSSQEETEGVVESIVKFCSFESLSNLEVNKTGKLTRGEKSVKNSYFFRKGKMGDWRNYLTVEMGERLDNIMQEKLFGSGLTLYKT